MRLLLLLLMSTVLAMPLACGPFFRGDQWAQYKNEDLDDWGWELGQTYVLARDVYITDDGALHLPKDDKPNFGAWRGTSGLPPIDAATDPATVLTAGTRVRLVSAAIQRRGVGEFYHLNARVLDGRHTGRVVNLENVSRSDSFGAFRIPEIVEVSSPSTAPAAELGSAARQGR
jgi:hypothetical protein